MALTLESVSAELATVRVDGRGLPGDQPRLADGRPRQLGRDPSQILRGLADEFRPLRRRSARPMLRAGFRARGRRRVRGGDAPGRGHDPHGGAGDRPRRSRRSTRPTLVALLDAGVPALRARRSSAHPTSCRCCATRVWSTRAARDSRCCSTRSSKSSTAGRSPSRSSSTTPAVGRRASRGERRLEHCATRSCTSSTRTTTTMPAFRDAWAAIGDSIVVVGGDGLWNCHVHTNDIGAAVEAGIDAGRPRNDPRHRPVRAGRGGALGARGRRRSPTSTAPRRPAGHDRGRRGRRRRRRPPPAHEPRRAAVVAGGQSMNPSTAQILEAVEACTRRLASIVLPNNKNIVAGRAAGRRAHRQAASRSSRPRAFPRRSPRSSSTTRTPTLDENEATMNAARDACAHRRGHAGGARRRGRSRRRCAQGRLDRAVARRHRRDHGSPGRRGVRAARQARRRRQRDRHRARRLPTRAAKTPSGSASTSSSRSRTSRSSSTTAASRCTRTSSAWNSGVAVPAGDPPLTLRGPARDRRSRA